MHEILKRLLCRKKIMRKTFLKLWLLMPSSLNRLHSDLKFDSLNPVCTYLGETFANSFDRTDDRSLDLGLHQRSLPKQQLPCLWISWKRRPLVVTQAKGFLSEFAIHLIVFGLCWWSCCPGIFAIFDLPGHKPGGWTLGFVLLDNNLLSAFTVHSLWCFLSLLTLFNVMLFNRNDRIHRHNLMHNTCVPLLAVMRWTLLSIRYIPLLRQSSIITRGESRVGGWYPGKTVSVTVEVRSPVLTGVETHTWHRRGWDVENNLLLSRTVLPPCPSRCGLMRVVAMGDHFIPTWGWNRSKVLRQFYALRFLNMLSGRTEKRWWRRWWRWWWWWKSWNGWW